MLGWLIHGDLAPAGNPVYLSATDTPPPMFSGYSPYWVQSGTAALALALQIARAGKPSIAHPSVILPAYGCPDLVAAAVFAGVRPILVDIGPDDPGYRLDQLTEALDPNTVAVVAVNFLGIKERLSAIRELIDGHDGVLLIEDNAQWFPEPPDATSIEGDLVCMSFGRGKPVSLLGGGLLLARDSLSPSPPWLSARKAANIELRAKAELFNRLLNPRLYWIANRNPLISLGATAYKPLHGIHSMDSGRLRSVGGAVARHLASPRRIEQLWREAVAELNGLKGIEVTARRQGRSLRYPILCEDAQLRDRLQSALRQEGLGVTAMYQVPLPRVNGVAPMVSLFSDYQGATSFAERLLTMPTHLRVSERHVQRAIRTIKEVARP